MHYNLGFTFSRWKPCGRFSHTGGWRDSTTRRWETECAGRRLLVPWCAARRVHVSDRRLYATALRSSAAEQLSGRPVCTTGKSGPALGAVGRRRATWCPQHNLWVPRRASRANSRCLLTGEPTPWLLFLCATNLFISCPPLSSSYHLKLAVGDLSSQKRRS